MTSAPAEFHAARHAALARRLSDEGLDALVVSHPANIAYLTGFFGSAGWVLATPERLHLISDTRYSEALASRAAALPHLDVVSAQPGGPPAEDLLAEAVARVAATRVGFEMDHQTVRQHLTLADGLSRRGARAELVATDGVVAALRAVKDAWEVETLREAGRRLAEVAKCIIPRVLEGAVEREVAARIEEELRRQGFERPAFDTIVASGPNAARPHHRAGERRLEADDLVVVDFGGVLRGYSVDMTRTVVLGRGTDRQRECLTAVEEAQQAAFDAARVGAAPEDVDAAARELLASRGMGDAFVHGLGHGLGLEVHERPRLTRRRAAGAEPPLAANMVFTLEPGVYFPGWGGVRIEDDVLATPSGPEWLTRAPGDTQAT